MTHVTGLNSSLPYHLARCNVSAQGFGLSADTANNLGYGTGRTIRGAFDSLWSTWQTMWTPKPSAIEIAKRRNCMIYKNGLRECVKLLGPALAKLQMNPRNRGTLKKVEQLATHFARYLKPIHEENLRELQTKILKPLEERVSAIARLHINNALSKWMPVFFQENQIELQLAHARQSQVMQEFPGTEAYSYQLIDGFGSVFSSLDAHLLNLLTIFPGVSAEPVEPDEKEVTVLAKDDQNVKTAQVKKAYIAYVVSQPPSGPGFASAINTSSNRIIANVTVGLGAYGIAITPNGRYGYVTNSLDNTVSFMDTYSNKVIANFPVDGFPTAIAITPDGQYVYVVVTKNNIISVFKTSNNTVKTTIPVPSCFSPGMIQPFVIHPKGLYAYVGCTFKNSSIKVIETTNNTVLTTIVLDNMPSGLAITRDGLYLYVTGNTVSVINTTSNAVVDTVKKLCVMPKAVAMTPDGLYAYVTCYANVSVMKTTNNAALTTIDVGNNPPLGLAITHDGLYTYVTSSLNINNYVSVINTSSNAVIATIPLDNSLGFLKAIAITPVEIPVPTNAPTSAPTGIPTPPTREPTSRPTITPTRGPTTTPTREPTSRPTIAPTSAPIGVPTSPTGAPIEAPTSNPTTSTPTRKPTEAPTTGNNNGLIIGLSFAGGGLIVLLSVGGYLIHRRRAVKKIEYKPLTNDMSGQDIASF